MWDFLHVWALAPAAAGACCLIADRRPAQLAHLLATLLMLLAMADVVVFRVLAPVAWGAILIVAAVVFAAVGRGRHSGFWPLSQPAVAYTRLAMTTNTSLGFIVMALLMVVMDGNGGDHVSLDGHHAQAVLPVSWVAAGAAVIHGTASILWAGSGSAACRDRSDERTKHLSQAHIALMGTSTVLMGMAVLTH